MYARIILLGLVFLGCTPFDGRSQTINSNPTNLRTEIEDLKIKFERLTARLDDLEIRPPAPKRQPSSERKARDVVVLVMHGEAAAYWFRQHNLSNNNEPPAGLTIQTIAILAQHLASGSFRIECSSPIPQHRKLLTVTGYLQPEHIEANSVVNVENIKDFRIRTWNLHDEFNPKDGATQRP